MRKLDVDVAGSSREIRKGLAEIVENLAGRFDSARGAPVKFAKDATLAKGGLSVEKSKAGVIVRYGRKVDAFRALGRLLGEEGAAAKQDFAETPRFETLGVQIEASRNGVPTVEAMKDLLRRFALMGLNMAILYAEDTYEIPGEPFFGYLRGRYTQAEMKELDDYADALGIEMFPCMQTLAHLAQALQWPAYAEYRDTGDILLAQNKKTYALIEKMLVAASAPFRSKRIHIGMDEAHGLGTGRFRRKYGEKRPFDVMNAHLTRVRGLCRKHGLKPMIWSDMYFRLGSKTDDYYDKQIVIPPDVVKKIPKDVQLVYWDYYHLGTDFYEEWIDRHRALGSEPIVAGGVWTWHRFWATLRFTTHITNACMTACKRKNAREVFMTTWGDDGMECDIFSALPGLQLFAEHGYADSVRPGLLRANFRGSCGADYDDFVKASDLDAVPCLESPDKSAANVSKWLLWQDPMLAIMDPQLDGCSLRKHYANLAKNLLAAARKGPLARRLIFPARIAEALSLKCDLRRDLASAYAKGDKRKLRRILNGDLLQLRKAVDRLWKCHRAMWLATYKPFGLEVLEGRYGGLRTRLATLSYRVKSYLDGETPSLPELEAKLERIFDAPEGTLPGTGYGRVATPSCIK